MADCDDATVRDPENLPVAAVRSLLLRDTDARSDVPHGTLDVVRQHQRLPDGDVPEPQRRRLGRLSRTPRHRRQPLLRARHRDRARSDRPEGSAQPAVLLQLGAAAQRLRDAARGGAPRVRRLEPEQSRRAPSRRRSTSRRRAAPTSRRSRRCRARTCRRCSRRSPRTRPSSSRTPTRSARSRARRGYGAGVGARPPRPGAGARAVRRAEHVELHAAGRREPARDRRHDRAPRTPIRST